MSAFKSLFVSICRRAGRLITCTLWQLPWLGIVAGAVWWFKHIIPAAIRSHFGLDQAQDRLTSLTAYAKTLKGMTSLSNPTSFFSYLSALLERTNANAKYATIQMAVSTAEAVVVWALDLALVIACIYAAVRVYRAYRAATKTYEMTKTIVNQINPQIDALHVQIAMLQEELAELKDELNHKK
jgi:threonine/homoserine/homoserine lactone efflux protein